MYTYIDTYLILFLLSLFIISLFTIIQHYHKSYSPSENVLSKFHTIALKVSKVDNLSHNTKLIRLQFPKPNMQLGLCCGKHIKIHADNVNYGNNVWNGSPCSDADCCVIERYYTPISRVNNEGYMDLIVKTYMPGTSTSNDGSVTSWENGGKMSAVL